MSEELETVKQVYQRFAEGDIEGFLDLCSESIEWVVNGPADLEKCDAFEGREGVMRFLDILNATWEFSSFEPKEFISGGSLVVVLGAEQGQDRNTEEEFSNRWAHVFDVSDGKIVRFREFLCNWRGADRPPPMTWA